MTAYPTRILPATDGGPQAQLVPRLAAHFAAKPASDLHVVHVGFVPAMYTRSCKDIALGSKKSSRRRSRPWTRRCNGSRPPAQKSRGRTYEWAARTSRSWSWPRSWTSA